MWEGPPARHIVLMTPPWAEGLRKDLAGGLVSAAVSIPLALGFGMFVFVSLGDAYFARGAVAGLIAAFVAGAVNIFLGDGTGTIYAPRIPTTFFLGSLLYSLSHSMAPGLDGAAPGFVLLVLFSIILLAGLIQALFGILRLGTLIKFTPHPVTAGFQNMAATLLFLVQLGNVLGYDYNVPFTRALSRLADAKPLNVVVAALTFAAMWHARKITTRVPPLLVGLGVGIVLYYGLALLGLSSALGPTIGVPLAGTIAPHPYVDLADTAMVARIAGLWPVVVPSAAALALIAAIDAMLCAQLASAPGDRRNDGNAMLVRLGLANAVSATVGGITSGINIGASVTNRAFGGHSRVSVGVSALVLLVTIGIALPFVMYLPRSVLSAVIMVVAIQHLDPWSKQATRRLFKTGLAGKRDLVLDLGVAAIVSILAIATHIVVAVFLGIGLAVALFVLRMSRSNVRRLYRCDTARSRRARPPDAMTILEAEGASILVIELQGALFFGSAERLARTIEAETVRATRAVILDMRRVTEIDSTGVHILGEIDADLARRGIALILVLQPRSETAERLAELPTERGPDIDRAIEQAEDDLLRRLTEAADEPGELPLEKVALLRDFTQDQIARLTPYLERRDAPADSTVFREGDPGSHVFLVTRGRASVRLVSSEHNIRLATFAPGTVFGELAILDRGPRSATVTADDALTVFALSVAGFAALQATEPDVALKFLSALGRELSVRLRQANLTIHQLEM